MTQPPAGHEPMSSEREYSGPPQAAQVEFNENSVDIKWIEDIEQSNAKKKNAAFDTNSPFPMLEPANSDITGEGDYYK